MFGLNEIFWEMIWLVKSNLHVGHKSISLVFQIYNSFDKLYINFALAPAL